MGELRVEPEVVEYFDATPRADSLIGGLRDFGYNLETALADVIDNSITAGATLIQIHAEFNGADSYISITDDGTGMSREVLHEVMRPGGRVENTRKGATDLGRFGLGMKTASFSQCTKLTVTSYMKGTAHSARWDLKEVAKTNEWRVSIPVTQDLTETAQEPRIHGTTIVWQDLDRLLEGADHARQQKDFNAKLAGAIDYLELVFHRFLQGDKRHKAISITVNGRALEPYDPLLPNHSATIKTPLEKIQFNGENIEVRAYTLPHHSKMSAADWEAAAGTRGHTANQGFYLYRARRLIVYGTWFGLYRKTTTSQLTRVSIDIPTTLDSEWKVNVLKASATPPLQLRERLGSLVPSLANASRKAYQNRGTLIDDSHRELIWNRTATNEGICYTINRLHPYVAQELVNSTPAESRRLTKLLSVIEAGLPLDALFIDLTNNPATTRNVYLGAAELRELVTLTLKRLLDTGLTLEEATSLMHMMEPFKAQWTDVQLLIATWGNEKRTNDEHAN